MRIRTKLVAYFLVIALLTPVLGGAALDRIHRIDNNVQDLSDNAVPRIGQVRQLSAIQRDQEAAALAYLASGRPEDRQAYLDLGPRFDQELSALGGASHTTEGAEKQRAVGAARSAFTTAGTRIVTARATRDQNLDNLHGKHDAITHGLDAIRGRYVPSGQSASDTFNVPQPIRNQVNDLLLATEGMSHMVAYEQSLASDYTITPDPSRRQAFDAAHSSFSGWFQMAYSAGGADDRAILTQVQSQIGEFEASAREMMGTADIVAKSLSAFSAASSQVQDTLDAYVTYESGELDAVKHASTAAVSSAWTTVTALTILGFILAGVAGFWLAGTITKPIQRLRDVADRVSTGDLDDVEIEVDSGDEIADLAAAFRRMVVSVRFLLSREDGEDEDTGLGLAS